MERPTFFHADLIKNVICVLMMDECLMGLEQHEGDDDRIFNIGSIIILSHIIA